MMIIHVMMIVAQEKEWPYIEWAPNDDFIPFVIEMYKRFHLSFDSFLIACA
jgi:hypothetical protein